MSATGQELIRKRKYDDESGEIQTDSGANLQQHVQAELREGHLMREQSGRGKYVEKKIRQRKRPYCCACERECIVEEDSEGLNCSRCGHDRCPVCLAGKVKNKGGHDLRSSCDQLEPETLVD